jgi:ribonuclease VapC
LIVIDTSVVVAIFQEEPERDRFLAVIVGASARAMSAGTYLECAMVTGRRTGGRADLDRWLAERMVEVVPVDLQMAQVAADAFARFGKGRHAAGLNYGDCFAYALARSLGVPLLYKGADFARTDIASALM